MRLACGFLHRAGSPGKSGPKEFLDQCAVATPGFEQRVESVALAREQLLDERAADELENLRHRRPIAALAIRRDQPGRFAETGRETVDLVFQGPIMFAPLGHL